MKIGCPKEIKNHAEYRVGLTPAAVKAYVGAGHEVFLEKDAGLGSGISDAEYLAVGARILDRAEDVWSEARMIVKVKEPFPGNTISLKPGQILYTYFHFAASEKLTRACLEKRIIAVAYETVQEEDGSLPLLKPMSEVAAAWRPGILLPHEGAGAAADSLPTGVPGVAPVLILGGGTVGSNAARVAAGLGAKSDGPRYQLQHPGAPGKYHASQCVPGLRDRSAIETGLSKAVIVIGVVLVTGARAPKLILRRHLKDMKPGSVFVDVSIDQGDAPKARAPPPTTIPSMWKRESSTTV